MELIAAENNKPAGENPDSLIEAQIPAQQFKDMGLKEGETLVVTPRRARVFVEGADSAPMTGEAFDPVV